MAELAEMNKKALRRSTRLATIVWDSNGRDHIAGLMGWSVPELETWMESTKVGPHLRAWYDVCIEGRRRFTEGKGWYKSGYFYKKSDLEADVLLECLAEGDQQSLNLAGFGDQSVNTVTWTTQELWARTAWHIVQSNCGKGDVFEKKIVAHPAAAYAVVIDILCIAFHSIAHRAPDSVWEDIVNNSVAADGHTLFMCQSQMSSAAVELDRDTDTENEDVERSEVDSFADTDTIASVNPSVLNPYERTRRTQPIKIPTFPEPATAEPDEDEIIAAMARFRVTKASTTSPTFTMDDGDTIVVLPRSPAKKTLRQIYDLMQKSMRADGERQPTERIDEKPENDTAAMAIEEAATQMDDEDGDTSAVAPWAPVQNTQRQIEDWMRTVKLADGEG